MLQIQIKNPDRNKCYLLKYFNMHNIYRGVFISYGETDIKSEVILVYF